ncbi:MAG: flavin reductase family protein [Planctomycetaceae bacterium]
MPRPSRDPAPAPAAPSAGGIDAAGELVDPLALALGRIPSGLYVVCWRDGCGDRTMLASWVMQAAFAPPMISLAIASAREMLSAISSGSEFVVNILGESQRPLAGRFARPAAPGEDPFAGLEVERVAGIAVIAGVAGWLHCRGTARAESGDHAVVIARILAGGSTGGAAPLVHVRRHGLRY